MLRMLCYVMCCLCVSMKLRQGCYDGCGLGRLVAGDSMLVDMVDSDAESLTGASSDASIPPPANFDDSLHAPAPPGELSEQSLAYANDAKEKSKTVNRYDCYFYLLSQILPTPHLMSLAQLRSLFFAKFVC